MRIVFLLSRIEKSGFTIHALYLAQGLKEEGHEVILITGGLTDYDNPYLGQLYKRVLDLGVIVKQFTHPRGNIFSKIWFGIIAARQILSWLNTIDYDILHAQSPYMTFLPWLIGKPFISTVHNVQLKRNFKYKEPDQLIAISKGSEQFAINSLGAKPESVSLVCHGVPHRFAKLPKMADRAYIRRNLEIAGDSLVLGYVGRITKGKGLDVLVNAVSENLMPEKVENVTLVFIGDYFSQEDEEWFNKIVNSSPIKDKIMVLPFQDPKPFYDIFDIFVLPSETEAFGLVCIEAMMSGNCVIRTDTHGARDQIIDGETGYIFPVGDAGKLAEIIDKLIDNSELRSRIADKGREFACNEFTLRTMTNRTLDVYRKVQLIG